MLALLNSFNIFSALNLNVSIKYVLKVGTFRARSFLCLTFRFVLRFCRLVLFFFFCSLVSPRSPLKIEHYSTLTVYYEKKLSLAIFLSKFLRIFYTQKHTSFAWWHMVFRICGNGSRTTYLVAFLYFSLLTYRNLRKLRLDFV